MCLLAVCENGILPEANFRAAFKINDDGFGFAFRHKEEVNYMKGFMDVDDAWDVYEAFSKEKIFPHIIHFRLGSPIIDLLTHPFEITLDSTLKLINNTKEDVLFHNGVISDWKDRVWDMIVATGKLPDGPVIDTRMAAIMCAKFGKGIFNYINGKFVIFGPDKLEMIGDFETDTDIPGIQFSNKSYKVYKQTQTYQNTWSCWNNRNGKLFTDKDIDDFVDEFII